MRDVPPRCPDRLSWCSDHRAHPDLDPGVEIHRGLVGTVSVIGPTGSREPIALWLEHFTGEALALRLDEWLLDAQAIGELAAGLTAARLVVR